jgi:hypothetical protein
LHSIAQVGFFGYCIADLQFGQQPTGGVCVNKICCSHKLQVCPGDNSPSG